MLRKSLLSLAVAASLAGMTGCKISSVEGNSDVDSLPVASGEPGYVAPAGTSSTAPVFNPAAGQLPLQIDIFFSDTTDGTLNFDERGGNEAIFAADGSVNPKYNPVFNALQNMDGFSTGGLIDIPFSASLDATSVAKFGLSVNPNVLLVPVEYTEGDDVVTDSLANGDSPTGFGTAVDADITAASYTGGVHANSVLRIAPKTPLMPKTRYLVIVTDGLKDSKGDKIRAASAYDDIRSDRDLVSPDLEPLRPAVRGWEDMAAAYLAGLNAVAGGTQGKGNVALAYTFTTGGTLDVLSVMAAPGNANVAIKTNAALAPLIDPSKTDAENIGTLEFAVASQPPFSLTSGAYISLQGASDEDSITTVATIKGLAAAALTVADIGVRPRASDFSGAAPITTGALTGRATVNNGSPNGATFVDGSIALPYFLSAPVGAYNDQNPLSNGYADPSLEATNPIVLSAGNVITSNWKADQTLATDLNNPALTAPSDRVTRLYPFAANTGYVDVPVFAVLPNPALCPGGKPAAGYPVAIYQHGIFSDRTSGVMIAEELAAKCYATVSIDMALHGVMPTDVGADGATPKLAYLLGSRGIDVSDASDPAADPEDKATATLKFTQGVLGERHFGLTPDAGFKPVSVSSITPAANKSGGFTLNVINFNATRDAFRQSIMDLLNLNASLATMDVDATANGPDLDPANVHFVGISYGGIIGATFAAVNNAQGKHFKDLLTLQGAESTFVGNENLPPLKTVNLGVTGGSIAKLAESSAVYGPQIQAAIVGGLGVPQGTESFEKLMQVFQGTLDSMDPVNFVGTLGQLQTPVHMIQSTGDISVSNSVAGLPLVGTEPLATILGATHIDEDTDLSLLSSPQKTFVKFTDIGSDHTTYAGLDVAGVPEDDDSFDEMFNQVFGLIDSTTDFSVGTIDSDQIVPVAAP